MNIWIKSKVLNIIDWNNNLFSVFIYNNISFISGQFIKLGFKLNNNEFIYKMFSIVSSPLDRRLELYIYNIKKDKFGIIFDGIKIGDYIYVSKDAYGKFIVDNLPSKDILFMIGCGTAISPYLSILNSKMNLLRNKFNKVIILYSVKYLYNLNYFDKFIKFKNIYPGNFLYFICFLSREKDIICNRYIKFFKGRLTNFFSNRFLKKNNFYFNIKDSCFMICGLPNMIKDVTFILKNKFNFNKKCIFLEKY